MGMNLEKFFACIIIICFSILIYFSILVKFPARKDREEVQKEQVRRLTESNQFVEANNNRVKVLWLFAASAIVEGTNTKERREFTTYGSDNTKLHPIPGEVWVVGLDDNAIPRFRRAD
jgi:hypothetical protein